MARKPAAPPAFDGKSFETPLREAFPTAKGKPRVVYSGQLPRFLQWLRGDAEFDGTGLADVVKTNADEQNAMKKHLDSLDAREASHHAAQKAEIAALRSQISERPFLSGRG